MQQQRPLPAAETGSCCWGSGQLDARLDQEPTHTLGAATRPRFVSEEKATAPSPLRLILCQNGVQAKLPCAGQ